MSAARSGYSALAHSTCSELGLGLGLGLALGLGLGLGFGFGFGLGFGLGLGLGLGLGPQHRGELVLPDISPISRLYLAYISPQHRGELVLPGEDRPHHQVREGGRDAHPAAALGELLARVEVRRVPVDHLVEHL